MSRNLERYTFWTHYNGTIYLTWTEYRSTPNGEPHAHTRRISTGTKDWPTAERFRAQFIEGLKNPAPPAEPTIGYLLDRYRSERGTQTRSLETIDNYMKRLKPFFGHLQPRHLSNNLFREFAESWPVSAGTILRALGILKAAIHYAEGNRWIQQQPQFLMPVRQPPPRDIWLTREQVTKLIEAAASNHMKLFIIIAVSTAARSGAILDLKWEQIDFENRLIDFGRGWGNKRRATVPMNDDIYESLKIAEQLRQSNYVIEYHGKQVHSIKSGFRRLCKMCSITASPHVLRHTAATWLIMDRVPLSEVARLLGDSERTVEKVYGKHAPDYLRKAVNSLNLTTRTLYSPTS